MRSITSVRLNSAKLASTPFKRLLGSAYSSGASLMASKAGWVAEQRITVASQNLARKFKARLNRVRHFTGSDCTSSMMIMELDRACIRRMAEVL